MKMAKLGRFFLLLFILLSTGTVSADESEILEEEVVVTATRIEETQLESPGMTEVISEEEIQASGATTIDELLMEKGFVISTYGASGAADIRFDGGDADQTLVMVNGIPVNSGTLSTVDLSYFPTAGISRIEIAHGPLSSLYGSNALGGVVNIITDLTGEPFNNLDLAYGNTDRGNADFGQATIRIQQEKYGLAFGGNINDGSRENSESNKYFLMYQYDFIQEKDETLSLYLQSTVKKCELPGAVYSPTLKDYQNDEIHGVSLNGKKYILGGLWEYKTYFDYWKETAYSELEGVVSDDEYDYTNYGVDAAGLYTLRNHKILLGSSYLESNTDSTAYGKHNLNNAGFFVQDSMNINDQWKLIPGLRWDTGSKYSSPVCPKISLIYLAKDNISFKLGYGKSFRAPTISDLYTSFSYYGYNYSGNPNLKPEVGERYDITGEWLKNRHLVGLNLYRSDLTDGIEWVYGTSSASPENFDKMKVMGLNLTWKTKWSDFFNSTVKYSRVEKETWDSDVGYSEDNFFGKNKLAVGLSYKYAAFYSNLSWEYVWDRSAQVDYSAYPYQSVAMKDYDVFNWNIAYVLNEAITYKLSVNNLTDEEYAIYHGYPVSERAYKLSVNYSF